jgi:hypothetical protein
LPVDFFVEALPSLAPPEDPFPLAVAVVPWLRPLP